MEIVHRTVEFVKETLREAEGGHDWWHIYRVWKTSMTLAEGENVDHLVVELGALLHDIADSKFHGGDEEIGPRRAREFLDSLGVDEPVIDHVECIIRNISFKGGNERQEFSSPELDIVQDADRLDAMGAVGIARAFNYGGYKERALYDPSVPPNQKMSSEEYKASRAPTINHFYEKLLLLKDRMNTTKGRQMAERRHEYMLNFLGQFYSEWEGRLPDEKQG